MNPPLAIAHSHIPIFRVVRVGWKNPLESSFSMTAPDNRWNDATFPALYCCCGEDVSRAVARDVFRLAGVELADLQPSFRPRLVEVRWKGTVVDAVSPEGLRAADLPENYPAAIEKSDTRLRAGRWHAARLEGVVCRSSSLYRLGLRVWTGAHERWSEIAVFTHNVVEPPVIIGDRLAFTW
jgi:hypothetical protein